MFKMYASIHSRSISRPLWRSVVKIAVLSAAMVSAMTGCEPDEPGQEDEDRLADDELLAEDDEGEHMVALEDEQVVARSTTPPKSASGFYQPVALSGGTKLNHNGTYQGGIFKTLFLDNQDYGATAKGAGYAGSACDTWDNVSKSKYEGIQCGSHPGVDIAVNTGTPVYAISSGTIHKRVTGCTVGDTGCGGGFGNQVVLKYSATSGGKTIVAYAVYAHLSSVGKNPATNSTWKVGESVPAAALLGLSGNTGNSKGPHLHFQIDKDIPGQSHPMWIHVAGLTNVNARDDAGKLRGYFWSALSSIGFGSAY